MEKSKPKLLYDKGMLQMIKIMRFTIILVLVSITQAFAVSSWSQQAKLTIDMKNARVEEVIDMIEKRTDFFFLYNRNMIDVDRRVDIKADDENLASVLGRLFEGTHVTYSVKDRQIMLVSRQSEVLLAQQPKTISGKVTDQAGLPLPGVTVSIKGTVQGAVTDVNGNYNISMVPAGSTLVFSFVGMKSREIAVAGESIIDMSMEEEAIGVGEVVVTALGIKKQARSLGYSTTEVKGDDLVEARDPNLGNALTGKIAGVSVANNATGIGGSSRVLIRGNASLTGNNQPLYVIDGVPFDNTNRGYSGQWGGFDLGDGLSNIDADNIAGVQVLKGAAASALYGFRGGNGAILITTKSGTASEKVEIEFNNNFTLSTIIDYRDAQYEYGQGTQGLKPTTQSNAYSNASSSWGARIDGSDAVNFLGDTYPYSGAKDNWKNFYRNGVNNSTSIGISGGNEQITYRVGFSNLYNGSIVPNSYHQQQGINLNTIYNISKKLQMTVTANYIFEKVKNRGRLSDTSTNIYGTLNYLANTFDVRWMKPAVDEDRNELTPGNGQYFNNPYFVAYHHQNMTDRNRLTGGITLKYDILEWLYLQGQITRDGYIFQFRRVTPTGTAYANGGELEEYERNDREMNYNFLIAAQVPVGDNFGMDFTFGGNRQDNKKEYYGLDGVASPFIIPYLYSADNIANATFTRDFAHYRVNSLYGSADFSFKNYLFLNFTGRNDWFSTLASDNNSYFYPSTSLSFIFTDALRLPEWLSFGKLRLAYAEASNGTDPYQLALSYGFEPYTITGQSVGEISNTSIPNATLKPVKIQEKEIGLTLNFLKNRLGLDVAVYTKKTTDDIATVSPSSASGYNSAILNVGKIRNNGFEALVTGVPVHTKDFKWDVAFNITVNKSEVLYLGDGIVSLDVDGAVPRNGSVTISNVVGKPYGQIRGYGYVRDDNGNIVFNANGYPRRTSSYVEHGTGVFKTTGGISNAFRYKNMFLSCLVDFKLGAKVFSGTNLVMYSSGLHETTLQGRESGYVGNGVTEDGSKNTTAVDAETYWQALAGSNNIAEEFIYNAGFFKLRELSIGYDLPAYKLGNIFIKGLRISLVSRNLATLKKHTPNVDPESAYNNTNGQGLELNGYPATRSFGFNLNMKF